MKSASIINILPKATKKCSGQHLGVERSVMIVIILLTIYSIGSFIPLVEAGESTPVINTTSGPVRGEVLKTVVKSLKYSSFKSIKYAEAPIGYHRFKPPVPVTPWTEVFNATVEVNACPQFNLIIRNYTGSEDCLFINVFTPLTTFDKKDEKSKAVMVWIYGGSFISGYATPMMYGADFLIEDDVILVTFNYRVGPLGFLHLNHPNATGNAGMKDQVLALKWINDNIEKFGGDPSRITIFGNSAGAVSVDLHTMSESSKGLFHGVIAISGSPLNPWAFHTREEAVNKSFALGLELGISTDSNEELLENLYKATPYQLAMATNRMGEVEPPFRPTVEDPNVANDHAFLTESPLDKYKSGNFTKVPYITGFTREETAYLYTGRQINMPEKTVKPIKDMVDSVITKVNKINQSLPLTSPTLQDLISTAENAIKQVPDVTLKEVVELSTFRFFAAGIDLKQRFLVAQSSNPVYYYRVTFNPALSLHEIIYHVVANGSAHADDLAYMFYLPLTGLPLDETDPIPITRRRVVRMWTNFAKYGNPTPHGAADPITKITWMPSGDSGVHLDIGDELSMGPRPVDALDKYLALLGSRDKSGTVSIDHI